MIESNDGGGTFRSTAGKRGRAKIIRPRSSITSRQRTKFPTTSAARSRIAPPSACQQRRRARRRRRTFGDRFMSVGGGESGYIAPDPKDPNIFYAGSQGALLTRYDRRTGNIARRPGLSAASSPAKPRPRCRSAGNGPSRSFFRRSIRTFFTRLRSISGRPPTTAKLDSASATI